jgi:hypothetical protein
LRYHTQRNTCPGWTAAGTRIPTAWNGDDINTTTQAEWQALVPSLSSAHVAGAQEIKF